MDKPTINEMLREVIGLNEGGPEIANEFSHAAGGRSGWSFGLCQFDCSNNATAVTILAKIGFSSEEITAIAKQTMSRPDVLALSPKLAAGAATIATYDQIQLDYLLNAAMNYCSDRGVPLDDAAAILAVADYWNQYGSMGDGAEAYFDGLGRPITAEDVLTFKLEHTEYGRKCPKDCRRRYNNVMKVVTANGVA